MRCSARRSRARSTRARPQERRTHDGRRLGGRHRLGPHVPRAGDGDDGRAGALLLGPGGAAERLQDHADAPRSAGGDPGAMGGRLVFEDVRRALDFAGGTVVHISAGVSALVAARMLGPRKDFKRTAIVPHNVPLVLLGAGLLWFGWFGFNAGSALAANGLAALAFTNTNTAAATALVAWVCLDLLRTGKATAVGAATGLVVGLVGITPAAGYITAPASLAVGALAVFVSYTAIQIRSKTRLDDSLDVFSCHGLAGMAGALLTGVFATKLANPAGGDGWLAGNFAQMGVQLVAILAAVVIAAAGTAVILGLLQVTLGAKAGVREQLSGLDLSEHGEEAYFGEQGATPSPGVSLGQGDGVAPCSPKRSEEHTSELQSRLHLVCRLLLEKKKKKKKANQATRQSATSRGHIS